MNQDEDHHPQLPTEESIRAEMAREAATLDPIAEAAVKDAVSRVAWHKSSRRYDVKLVQAEGGGITLAPSMGGEITNDVRMLAAFGSPAPEFAHSMLGRLASLATPPGKSAPSEAQLNAALAVVDGVRPENETEAMLAIQMYGTHETAMQMLVKAKSAQDPQTAQEAGNLAIKLMRTYTAQIEALSKLRRGGEQKVRVEHVHVYPGGKAVVGDVTVNNGLRQAGEMPEHIEGHAEHAPSLAPLGHRRS